MGRTETAQKEKSRNLPVFLKEWFFRNKIYFIAFFIPVAIMYAAYVIFKFYPFGDNSVLVLDLNGQYVYYFESLRDAFWSGDKSALYNWARNLSGGFAGVIGYYLASPYTLIVMLLPRKMLLGSLLIMQLAKIGSSAVTFCYYLRKSKGLGQIQALVFSSLYALCAYGVIQLIDPMWLDGMILLPLIVLGVEYLIDDGRKLNLIIPLAVMMIANFYIGWMICIFTALYFFFYLIFGSRKTGTKRKISDILMTLVRMGISTLTALACAAIMLLPVYNALKLGKFDFTEPDFSYKTQFKFMDFFAQLLPAQYDTVNVEGHPEIYCGLLTAVLLPMFFLNDKISGLRKTGYGILAAILVTCMLIKPVDMVWHGFQMPNWLPFRYSFTFSFVLLSMAAEAFKNHEGIKLPSVIGSFAVITTFLMITLSRILEEDITLFNKDKIPDVTRKDVYISLVLVAVYCIIVFLYQKKIKFINIIAPIALIVISSGELLYNCVDTLKTEDTDISYSKRSSWYNFIDNSRELTKTLYDYDGGFYRAEKTYHRMVNDNAAIGLRGLSHSSSVMNAKILKFLEAMGYSSCSYFSRYDGATPIADSVLGIKYAMDRNAKKNVGTSDYKRIADPAYNPVFSYEYKNEKDEDTIVDVYQNPYALSIGFMADKNILNIEKFGNDNTFNSQNILMSTISGNTAINYETGQFDYFDEYFRRLDVDPEKFVLNNVTTSPYGEQTMYTAGEGDPTVDMFIKVPSENPIYMYFKTENEKSVNLWLTRPDKNGEYDSVKADFVGSYFENHNYHTICLGKFNPGEVIRLRMTVANEYTIVKNFFFYEFDEDLFAQAAEKLQQNPWELTKVSGRTLEGTITAEEGQLMLTSIPYEPGWTVKVDGKNVKPREIAQALIGVELEPGKHTVKMTYTPPGMSTGAILLVIGIAAIVLIYKYDKKHIRVPIAEKNDSVKAIDKESPQNSDDSQETPETPEAQETQESQETQETQDSQDTQTDS